MNVKYQSIRMKSGAELLFAIRYVWDRAQFSLDMKTWHKSPAAALKAYMA